MHLLPMSVLLFNVLGLLRFLIISTFSMRQSWHVLMPGIYFWHFVFNSHFTVGEGLALFSQMYVDSVVLHFFFFFSEGVIVVVKPSFECIVRYPYVFGFTSVGAI